MDDFVGEIFSMSTLFADAKIIQVTRATVEQYTGVGKPPYCEMMLKAAMPDNSTPPDLTLPVTLTGVKQPTTRLERVAETSLTDIVGKEKGLFHCKKNIN